MYGLPDSGTGGLVGDDLLHLVEVDGYLRQASLLLLRRRIFDEMSQKDRFRTNGDILQALSRK